MKDFLNEFCMMADLSRTIPRRELYLLYMTRRREIKQYCMSPVSFGRELSGLGVVGDDGKRNWLGIQIRQVGDKLPEVKEW